MIEVIETPPETYTRKRRYQLMGTEVHSSDYQMQQLQQQYRSRLHGLGDGFDVNALVNWVGEKVGANQPSSLTTAARSLMSSASDALKALSNSYLANVTRAYGNPLPAPSGTAKAVDKFAVPNDILIYARYGYAAARKMFTNHTLVTYGREAIDAWGMAMWAYWYAGNTADVNLSMTAQVNQDAWQQIRVGNAWADKARKIAPQPVSTGGGGGKKEEDPVKKDEPPVGEKLAWYKTGVGMAGIGLAGVALLMLLFKKKPQDQRSLPAF